MSDTFRLLTQEEIDQLTEEDEERYKKFLIDQIIERDNKSKQQKLEILMLLLRLSNK